MRGFCVLDMKGFSVREAEGLAVGKPAGFLVGFDLGTPVGLCERVGLGVGKGVGFLEGFSVGAVVGLCVLRTGIDDGLRVGGRLGDFVIVSAGRVASISLCAACPSTKLEAASAIRFS